MKFAAVALLAAVAATAQSTQTPQWSQCHQTCADSVSKNATVAPNCEGVSNWTDNKCLCNGDYQFQVKNCLYRSDCNTDVPKWFDEAEKVCGEVDMPARGGGRGGGGGGSSASAAAAAPSATGNSATRLGVAGGLVVPAVVAGALLL